MTRVTSPLETTVCSLEMILAWVSLPAGEVGKSMRGISKPLISSSQVTASTHSSWCSFSHRSQKRDGTPLCYSEWKSDEGGGGGLSHRIHLRNMCNNEGSGRAYSFLQRSQWGWIHKCEHLHNKALVVGWELKTGWSSHWNQCGQITVILVRASERESGN